MSLAVVYARAQIGINAPLVSVESHLANGLPALSIVGLAETEVKESKDRVRAAIINSKFDFPARRITINLAPADLPKEGGRFDLAIALGILAASGQIPANRLDEFEFSGELALSGQLRGVRGTLPAAIQAAHQGRTLIVPADNAYEASLVSAANVLPAASLLEVCAHLAGQVPLLPYLPQHEPASIAHPDLADVKAQHHAKRALEIAAAGNHSILMVGPPGTGKTMLASRLPGILPPMTESEALQTAALHSISYQGFDHSLWKTRPFRQPHHTASAVALVGGGSKPRPGEISLAHNGVVFLDELPEFDRRVLEVLREPLESGHITISRAARQADFPARFQLIAAMNPCPCGYHGHPSGRCRCSPDQITRYRHKISGPLLDRIDLHIEVPSVPPEVLRTTDCNQTEASESVRKRVSRAREVQVQRCGFANSHMKHHEIDHHCQPDSAGRELLEQAINKLGLSARAYHRVLKVARTIADLGESDAILSPHISEAIGYRRMDRLAN